MSRVRLKPLTKGLTDSQREVPQTRLLCCTCRKLTMQSLLVFLAHSLVLSDEGLLRTKRSVQGHG